MLMVMCHNLRVQTFVEVMISQWTIEAAVTSGEYFRFG